MSIIQRVPWRVQPQGVAGVNWGNPLCRDLTLAILPSLNFKNVASSPQLLSNLLTPTIGPKGKEGTGTPAAGWAKFRDYGASDLEASLWDVPVFTAMVLSRQDVNANDGTALIRGNGSAGNQWNIGLYSGSNNGVRGQVNTTTFVPPGSGSGRIAAPSMVTLLADGTNASMYLNGIQQYSTQVYTAPTYAYSAGRSLYLNATSNIVSSTASLNGLYLFWRRALSPKEILHVSENPWQIFAPQRSTLWLPPSASGPAFLPAPPRIISQAIQRSHW